MENELIVIDHIRYSDDMWTNAEDGSFIISISELPGTYKPSFCLPESVLSDKHHELPKAIRALINHNSLEGSDGFAYFKQVYATIEYLRGCTLEFTDTTGVSRVLSQIREFETDTEKQVAHLKAAPLILHKVEVLNAIVVFAESDNKPLTMSVSYSELTNKYPNWDKRWEMGSELGMSLDALLSLAFSKVEIDKPLTDMTHIIFE